MPGSRVNAGPIAVPAPAAHAIMFWVLTSMAIGVFAPCVLVPIWTQTEEIVAYEGSVAALVAELEAQRDQNDDRLHALLRDPLVNERLARRELNHRPDHEQVVHWPARELAAVRLELPASPNRIQPQPGNPPPAWVATLNRWLPDRPWRKLFVPPANRSLLLLMAGGLFVAAFLLYGPTHTAQKSRHPGRRSGLVQ